MLTNAAADVISHPDVQNRVPTVSGNVGVLTLVFHRNVSGLVTGLLRRFAPRKRLFLTTNCEPVGRRNPVTLLTQAFSLPFPTACIFLSATKLQ